MLCCVLTLFIIKDACSTGVMGEIFPVLHQQSKKARGVILNDVVHNTTKMLRLYNYKSISLMPCG